MNPTMINETVSDRFLTRVLLSGSPSHAYLFFGSSRSSKEAQAKIFAQTLLCEKGGTEPCQTCLACKKVVTQNHPDFRVIVPDGDKIKIGQIRAVKREAQYGPLERPWKIFIIPESESLTEEAAQSMLKLLEEPPPKVIFILTAPHPSSLLPTMASRCQWIPFPDEPENSEERKAWEALLSTTSNSLFPDTAGALGFFDRVTTLEDFKEDWDKLIHLLLSVYRDAAVLKSGWEDGVAFPSVKPYAEALAKRLSWHEILERSQKIKETEDYLQHSGNFRLAMENLLHKLG